MKNKKTIMTFAALLILFFHLWIYVGNGSELESFLKNTSYCGVDIFFFLSAYSLSEKKISSCKSFVLSRFKAVYLKFILMAAAAFFYSGWRVGRLLRVISGWEFFERGGGSFLWFAPAIMLFYLLVPLIKKAADRRYLLTIMGVLALWFIVGVLVTKLTKYTAIFIFWNRIPAMLLGAVCGRSAVFSRILANKRKSIILGACLLTAGTVLVYFTGYKICIRDPIADMFYIMAIPSTLGWILLLSQIPENPVTINLGSATFELYGLQMIFGYNIANKLFQRIGSPLITNIIVIFIVCLAAVIAAKVYGTISGMISLKKHSEN